MTTASRRPLILAYHAVGSRWQSTLSVEESALREQLELLRARGYEGLTLVEAERRRRERTLPERALVVTFDDGYASTLRAVPILAELGFPGTVFLVTAFVDSGERLSWLGIDGPAEAAAGDELRPLTWEDAERLVKAGWEVGSHTVRHPLLTRLDDERLDEELRASRAAIAARLGSCTSLSYPYGIADPRVAAAARRAGYDTGCTLTFVELADEPLRRPRTGLDDGDRGLRLRVKLSRPVAASRRTALARLARRARRRRSWIPG